MESGKDEDISQVAKVAEGNVCTVFPETDSQVVSLAGNVERVESDLSESQKSLLTVEEEDKNPNQKITSCSANKDNLIQEVSDSVAMVDIVPVADKDLNISFKQTSHSVKENSFEEDDKLTKTALAEKVEELHGNSCAELEGGNESTEANRLTTGTEDFAEATTCETTNGLGNGQAKDVPSSQPPKIQTRLEINDSITLNENILNKTTELIQSIETGDDDSSSAKQSSSLCLLSQYKSDSDHESNTGDADCEDNDVMEVPLDPNQDYRNKVVEIQSESESESSSSDDSDLEYLNTIRKEIKKTIDLEDDEDDDEEGDSSNRNDKKKKKQNEMRVKGELLLEDLPPIQDLHITVPEEECVELGKVHSIVDQLLLVSVLPDSLLLDLETVLFLEKGKKVLGEVFDVLGQVADPLYCVRFNSHKEIEEKGIKVGDKVYVAPKTKYTQFVILSNLMKLRGSDASWENDVEPPPRYLDYSDDEQEREANARLRNQDRPNDHEEPAKRSRNNNDNEPTSTASSPSSSQPSGVQDGSRFHHNRGYRNRPPYQRNQTPSNAMHTGSWHSNYRQPYSSYSNMHMMSHQAQNPMHSPYQSPAYQPYIPGPFTPTMPPHHMPSNTPPMYVLNPLAVARPSLANNMSHNMFQRFPQSRSSPPPAPPGLD